MHNGHRDNPFSSHLVEPSCGGYIFADDDGRLEDVLEALRQRSWRGELCGPHGAGKSTMLTDICARLEAQGLRLARWRCTEGSHLLPRHWVAELRDADVVILDGGERLLPGLLWLLRGTTVLHQKGLILTTHTRRGIGACIPVVPNARALAAKVQQLAGTATVGSGELTHKQLTEQQASEMSERLHQHGGNAREVLFELYLEHEEQGREGL